MMCLFIVYWTHWGWVSAHQGWESPLGFGTVCCHNHVSRTRRAHTCTTEPEPTLANASLTHHVCTEKKICKSQPRGFGDIPWTGVSLTGRVNLRCCFVLRWTSRNFSTASPQEKTAGSPSRPESPAHANTHYKTTTKLNWDLSYRGAFDLLVPTSQCSL